MPISIATAVYLTEVAPLWLRQPLIMFIELLAAVPVSFSACGGNFCDGTVAAGILFPRLQKTFGFLPFFKGPIYGVSMLAGASLSPS